jgi:hypothetical protein
LGRGGGFSSEIGGTELRAIREFSLEVFAYWGCSGSSANGGPPALKIFGVLVVLLVFLLGLCGSAGLCLRIGKGLVNPIDEVQPWLRVKRGGIVLGLMFIFPVLGWFLVFPVAVFSGIGTAFLGWRELKKDRSE